MFGNVKFKPAFSRRLSMPVKTMALAILLMVVVPATSHAVTAQVEGGMTSVVFGNGALDALGLSITGATNVGPGNLGPNSVSFGINSRNEGGGALSTTFTYDSLMFAPFSGSIEHSGTLQFNNAIDVGNFTIRAANDRPVGTSGFVVESTFGLEAILFDIANPIIEPFENSLIIGANILVSPELAMVLQNESVIGLDAGMALVDAGSTVVPIPAAAWLFGAGLVGLMGIARRKQLK